MNIDRSPLGLVPVQVHFRHHFYSVFGIVMWSWTVVFVVMFPASSRADPVVSVPPASKEQVADGLSENTENVNVGEQSHSVPEPLVGSKLYVTRVTHFSTVSTTAHEAYTEFASRRTGGRLDELAKTPGKSGAPARLWKFLSAVRAMQVSDALGALQTLRFDFPQLRDWLVLHAAYAHLSAGNLEEARALAQVVETGPYRIEGLRIQVEMARQTRDFIALEKLLKVFIGMDLTKIEAAMARLELAKLMLARKLPVHAWKNHLVWIWSALPQSQFARDAEKIANFSELGPIAKWASCEQKIERATHLSDLQLHESVVETLSSLDQCNQNEKCQALYWRGRSLFFLKKRREAASVLVKAVQQCEKTRNIELRVRAKYVAGRNERQLGNPTQAAAYFRRVYREHPDDTYADDALYQEAMALLAQEKRAVALKKLQELVQRYPQGDQVGQAAWRIVLEDLQAGKWAIAGAALGKVRNQLVPEAPFEDWGRLLYWQGRCAQLQQKATDARKLYAETVATAPGTYYALLALHRLEEITAGEGTALLKKLMSVSSPSVWPWSVLEHPDFAKPAFSRIVAFAQLGLPGEIPRELKLLQRELPGKPQDISDADRPFWRAMMHVYLTMGEVLTAARLQGRLLYDYAQGWPAGNLRKLWEVAYPRVYAVEIDAAAARFGISAHLLSGLIREESFFNATIRSSAGALGLGQLMPATARQLAVATGITVNSDADLLVPSTNIVLAAAYLATLHKHFHGNLVMMVGAYNAGQNALSRWRSQHATQPLDLWVELLDVSETRNYIKRVLSSMFAYYLLSNIVDFPRIDLK